LAGWQSDSSRNASPVRSPSRVHAPVTEPLTSTPHPSRTANHISRREPDSENANPRHASFRSSVGGITNRKPAALRPREQHQRVFGTHDIEPSLRSGDTGSSQ
jgi:hypothetical protein